MNPVISCIWQEAQAFARQAVIDSPAGDLPEAARPDLSRIDQLCAWSFSPESLVAKAATSALFSGIIEPLCDDFSDHGIRMANLVLTRILQFIRTTPDGGELNSLLNAFGFHNADDLLARHQRILANASLREEQTRAVKKILILSRVTAGADIAITNVIIHRLRQHFPTVELVLIGPRHLAEIFANVPGCRHRNFIYKNDGSLFDKMTSWPRLLEITADEQRGLQPDEFLLFDPDTRLSQLGLLPLAPDSCTCYFPSRASQTCPTARHNLSSLTNHWLNRLLGETLEWRPNLFFQKKGEGYHRFGQALRHQGCRRLVTINFGVGNDPRKKVHGSFEEHLIQSLLARPGIIVILDTGRGGHKDQWIADHLARAQSQGWAAACLSDAEIGNNAITFGHGLIIFKGSLGSLGKMIDAADCFIGYDSCGQHLAAATGTPSVIVFAGAPSTRFIERWSPHAAGSLTIPINGLTATPQEISRLIDDIVRAVEAVPTKN